VVSIVVNEWIVTVYDIGKHVSIVVNGNEGIVAVSDIYKLPCFIIS